MSFLKTMAMSLILSCFAFAQAPTGSFELHVEIVRGDRLCTLLAKDAPVQAMLQELADRVGLEIDGLRHIPSNQGATVRLEKRPLAQLLQYVVGASGVRSSTTSKKIILRPALPPFPTEEDLFDQADLAYRRALRYAPNSEFADQAEFALGRIAEDRGQLDTALGHYDLLFDERPDSSRVPEALFRSGSLRLDAGRFEDAALALSALVGLERAHEFGVDAHRMLALCTTQLGNHQRALYHLDALEKEYPAETGEERAARDFIRARALVGLGEAASALRLLERKDSRIHSGRHPGERIELIAAAMQVHGRHGDASLAWMEYAGRADGAEQARAFGNAARLALLSKDELGTLMICQQAKSLGHHAAVERWDNEARMRLDLVESEISTSTADQRIAYAEKLLRDGLDTEARSILAPMATIRERLEGELLMRFTIAYAHAQSAAGQVEVGNAIDTIRMAVARFEDPEDRSRLYLLAAELLENAGLFDRAIDAYRGRL